MLFTCKFTFQKKKYKPHFVIVHDTQARIV